MGKQAIRKGKAKRRRDMVVSFRVDRKLKREIEATASASDLSVNTWLRLTIRKAIEQPAESAA